MKRSEVNKDPDRARKRAASDLRCAVRKLGIRKALDEISRMMVEEAGQVTEQACVVQAAGVSHAASKKGAA